MPTARVYLIGAGPGDPGLLTLRGRQRLAAADVVLYDYLVNPQALRYARPGAELVCLGRHGQGHGRVLSQGEVHQRMIAAAQAGKAVARLKGGDPAIFGRTAEEIAALEAAGVAYEIVPGVSAAQAASAYAGIPLTSRESASGVAFITGQLCRDKPGESLDLEGIARFPGTLVFYMGVTSAAEWAAGLMAHGKPAETPVAIVRRASLPQQQVLTATLGELADVVARAKLRPPAVMIVGEAARARASFDWFASRPLHGQTVLVTRPVHQADALAEQLSELGAAVLFQPAIEITPPADWAPVDAAIENLAAYDWLVFSSANGVAAFIERLQHHRLDLRALHRAKLAAIGPATAEALAEYRLRADLQPDEFRAEALAAALAAEGVGRRFLLLRASRGREVLAEALAAAGAAVEQVVVYQSRDVTTADVEVSAALAAGRIDWITVTSSAIARALVHLFGDHLRNARLAAISPITAGVLEEMGHQAAAVATTYTAQGLAEAIVARSPVAQPPSF
ncbi:MAG: uroporphyrinogen-III C-methyltransferase [Planctomycetota bacterium]|nr:MAG: uroporphyrinogen-III C-methyltransferase [Planctomycetota bacterium]